jgi:short-subunit dehydrogenase
MKNVVVLGATRGLGLALARYYLQQGDAVWLCGRHVDVLKTSELVRHSRADVMAVDITDVNQLNAQLAQIGRIDLLIVTAGIYYNTRGHRLDALEAKEMLSTNISGLVNSFETVAAQMVAQGQGHLVAVSSVAGLMPDYPGASAYSATKRTVLAVCDAYRAALKPLGVAVTAVVPGYIDTEKLRQLNHGDTSEKPFLMSEADAVIQITQAIQKKESIRIFPWQMKWLVFLMGHWPVWPCVAFYLGRHRFRRDVVSSPIQPEKNADS